MQFLEKTIKNVRKHIDIKLVSIKRRRNYLVSKPNYDTTEINYRKCISNRNEKKTEILMNKPVHLGLSILELSKILMSEFWYDYLKPKLCHRYG